MTKQQIHTLNIWSFGLLLATSLLSTTPLQTYTQPIRVTVATLIVFFISGANISYLMQFFLRRNFTLPLFVSLSLLNSLFIPPLVLLILYRQIHYVSPTSVALTYLLFAFIPFINPSLIKKALRQPSNFQPKQLILPAAPSFKSPLIWAVIIGIIIQTVIVLQFRFLPVPDSYSWLLSFEEKLTLHQIPISPSGNRASFSSLFSAVYFLTNLRPFFLFKYFFPFLFLLSFAPLYLAARGLRSKTLQFVFLLALFISPTVILELGYVRQQIIFLIFLYFAVGLSIYAHRHKDSILYYLIGLYALLGIFTHPAFLVFILTWLLSFALSKVKWAWRHKPVAILIFLAALPIAQKLNIANMFVRIYEQARAAWRSFLYLRWNLKFPAYFINSDNYEMSWSGATGVIKYYAFYAGPIALIILALFVVLLATSSSFRHLSKTFFLNKFTATITLPAGLFLLIAEIIPRFGNIAFLPDRAWQYLGILLIIILFFFLNLMDQKTIYSKTAHRYTAILTVLVFYLVNISGALYVNYLTRYTMPDYEFKAAAWIQDNIPSPYRIFSSSSKNLIRYHIGAVYGGFQPEDYTSSDKNTILNHLSSQIDIPTKTYSNLQRISALLSELADAPHRAKLNLEKAIKYHQISIDTFNNLHQTRQAIQKDLDELTLLIEQEKQVQITRQLTASNLPALYIYYAKTHPKNPYASRPYKSSFTTNQNIIAFPALDGNPDTFQRVYEDGDKVIIWQVITKNTQPL